MFTNWKKIRGLGPRRRLTLASARSDLASLSVTFHFIRNFVSLQSPSHIYRCAWISEIVVEHRICVTRMSVCVLLQRWLYLLFLSWVEVWNIVSVPSDQIFISLLLFFLMYWMKNGQPCLYGQFLSFLQISVSILQVIFMLMTPNHCLPPRTTFQILHPNTYWAFPLEYCPGVNRASQNLKCHFLLFNHFFISWMSFTNYFHSSS